MDQAGSAAGGVPASGALSPAVSETHTGLVILAGDRAYKVKKAVVTDFLDFSTVDRRERACAHEVELNSRLAPESYLGVAHFTLPGTDPEPVIVMRRHSDDDRLATLVRRGADVRDRLAAVAALLARFHDRALRGPRIDDQARPDAVAVRWRENLDELGRYAGDPANGLDGDVVAEIGRLATAFIAGRAALFGQRIAARRIVDGHADLIADDIFCLPAGPALLDCLEFDDRLRYVDVLDDIAFLAMDLEFLGRPDLGAFFVRSYLDRTGDDAPPALRHFYTAYRAVVRAKVDCVRVGQGHPEAAADATRHLGIARTHLVAGAVRLILVGGGPGTGKTTVARGLAAALGATLICTDDVRAAMVRGGHLTGQPGVLGAGLYTPGNVDAVYQAALRQAGPALATGRTVILDGTWQDPVQRGRAAELAARSGATQVELACGAPLQTSLERIRGRTVTTSQVTDRIAAALADRGDGIWAGSHRLDTTRPLDDTVAEAHAVCLAAR